MRYTMSDLVQHYSWRKAGLMSKLNAGVLIPSDWVDFINDARKDGMYAMANDMEKRYVYYLKRELQK